MSKNKSALSMFVRIAIILVILISCSAYMVLGKDMQIAVVKVQFSNNSEINIFTTKTKIADILEEANIILEDDETVLPGLEDTLTEDKQIAICKVEDEVIVLKEQNIDFENLGESYANITEKIEKIQEKIPFETIKKDATGTGTKATNTVLQKGKDGLKETVYKVQYRNDVEVLRKEISSKILKKPVNQIVQVVTNPVSSRNSPVRNATLSSGALASKVEGKTPKVATMNTSAYCSCAKCCGKTNGITASGAKATAWYTVAAGKGYKMGTIIYIPSLKNSPNGGWFVVQDRGGAISNNKLDVYMGSHNQALQFGRKNLTCYIYEV